MQMRSMKGKLQGNETLDKNEKQTYSRIRPPSTIAFLFFLYPLEMRLFCYNCLNCIIDFELSEEPPLTPGLCLRFKTKSAFFAFSHPSIHKVVRHNFTDTGKQTVKTVMLYDSEEPVWSSHRILGGRWDICLQCFLPVLLKKGKRKRTI